MIKILFLCCFFFVLLLFFILFPFLEFNVKNWIFCRETFDSLRKDERLFFFKGVRANNEKKTHYLGLIAQRRSDSRVKEL